MASGNGNPAMIGAVAPRTPTVATGTIGTPDRIAWRTKPFRPARTALSRLRQLRIASCSPPGHTTTSWPAASALVTPSRDAGITPTARK